MVGAKSALRSLTQAGANPVLDECNRLFSTVIRNMLDFPALPSFYRIICIAGLRGRLANCRKWRNERSTKQPQSPAPRLPPLRPNWPDLLRQNGYLPSVVRPVVPLREKSANSAAANRATIRIGTADRSQRI